MYVGVDVGGTKTLLAALDDAGVIVEQVKFPTPQLYDDFLRQLREELAGLTTKDFRAGGIAIPGKLDRKHGRALSLGNLGWKNIAVQHDTEQLFGCPMVVENDAKLAGLSEAMLLKGKQRVVLYVTISTGIGTALVVDGMIDTNIGDGGGRTIMLEHKGKLMAWEDFASGRAIVERFGKRAADITDEKTWKIISHDLAKGLIHLIAITQPEAIVIGGGVGTYFERFKHLLEAELQQYKIPMIDLPKLVQAQRPETAVLYGCYDVAKQVYPNA